MPILTNQIFPGFAPAHGTGRYRGAAEPGSRGSAGWSVCPAPGAAKTCDMWWLGPGSSTCLGEDRTGFLRMSGAKAYVSRGSGREKELKETRDEKRETRDEKGGDSRDGG